MTLTTIQAIVDRIQHRALNGDNEEAHALKDKLYRDFIKDISYGDTKDVIEKAKEVLKASKINYERWYA